MCHKSQVSDQPDERVSESLIYGKTAGQKNKIKCKGFVYLLLRNFLKANKYDIDKPLKKDLLSCQRQW